MPTFEVHTLEDLDQVAAALLPYTATYSVFCFYGNLGAGKTTLVSALCGQLGVTDTVSSPTYPIIQEYHTNDGTVVYHIDLYRLESEEEALNIGLEEYLYSGSLCLVEWPDRFEKLMPEQHLTIKISKFDTYRTIRIAAPSP